MQVTDPQAQQPTPRTRELSIDDIAVVGRDDRYDVEPMTDQERQQWAALDRERIAQMQQTRANAAARCGCGATHA